MNEPATEAANPAALESAKTITTVVYALQAAALVVGLTFIAAAIVNYVKMGDVRGTWLESHFRWQLRTFWFGMLWGFVGMVLLFVFIGWFVLIGNMLWVIYRIVKGWVRLADGRPMYEETAAA